MTSTDVHLVRRELAETARTFVVKIGTNVLSRADDTLDVDRLRVLADQIERVRAAGKQVVVVSSGAVGAGIGLLGLPGRPTDLPHLQAAAAAGQAQLIRQWDEQFRRHGYHAAQILVTGEDFKTRSRYLNVRNTLFTLFEYGAVPVVNENDTVSVDEIKFGDNDQLAAMVTNLLPAPLLIVLTSVDGLFDGPPDDPGSRVVPLVSEWNDELLDHVAPETSSRGRGGMGSKLRAIQMATAVGENVIVANGRSDGVLDDILDGHEVGTLFLADGQSIRAWKRWIGYTVEPKGRLVLDEGACQAILSDGRSLLAIGVTDVEGNFEQGQVVSLAGPDGREIARGLSNYDARDARAIRGKRTAEISDVLGSLPYVEVVHRDNLVVL